MRSVIFAPLLSLLLFPFIACKKDGLGEASCQELKNGIMTTQKEEVRMAITHFISNLPSANYTGENLAKLAAAIKNRCTIDVAVLCFDCIETNPTQSEIRISFVNGTNKVEKTIDISYNSK